MVGVQEMVLHLTVSGCVYEFKGLMKLKQVEKIYFGGSGMQRKGKTKFQ